jgi:hypothetical protein
VVSGTADQLLGGRYRLLTPIGTGGMAVVWRARDEVLGRDVAVKLLSLDLETDRASRERIRAEAQAVARLSHPNITSVHDYGESPADGAPYVVMELLVGELLSVRLRAGSMSWRRATQLCAQVAAALAAAHDRGVVHRDIKPTNVMLTAAGAKVLDFGVAGLTGSPDEPPDADLGGTVFGTPAYLAPERLLGGEVVLPASDVYALGILLYRCLTDRLPWQADTPTQMIANHFYEPPNPLPAIDGLPADVADLVRRCLAKDPARRPPAVEAARILASATGIYVVLPDADGTNTQEVHGPLADGARSTVERRWLPYQRRRRAVRAVAVALAAAGIAGLLGTLVWQSAARHGRSSGTGATGLVTGTATPGCRVNFFIRPEANRMFRARVTVVNTGKTTLQPWTVAFTFPGSEQVSASDGADYAQNGTEVRLTGDELLPPGRAITAGMSGDAGVRPGPPTSFALNGIACDTRLAADGYLPPVTPVTAPPTDLDATHGPPMRPPGGPPGQPPPDPLRSNVPSGHRTDSTQPDAA